MINFKVRRGNDLITEIDVSGHSGYDEAGRDIVCAAVSTAMFLSVGLIEKVCPDYDFASDEDGVTMNLKINKSNEFTELILDNLVSSVESVSLDYKKYLKVKYNK